MGVSSSDVQKAELSSMPAKSFWKFGVSSFVERPGILQSLVIKDGRRTESHRERRCTLSPGPNRLVCMRYRIRSRSDVLRDAQRH